MTGAAYVKLNNGWLKMPEDKPEMTFCERAKKIYKSKRIDPAKKEEMIIGLYMRDFMSHPHNEKLPPKEMLDLATEYATEMMTSLNEGTI
jgi:hypothetical protein